MGQLSILTDIEIKRCKIWCSSTTYTGTKFKYSLLRKYLGKLYNTLHPVLSVLDIIYCYRNFDVVVTSNIRTSLLFGLFRKIFCDDNVIHIALEFMLDEDTGSNIWSIKRTLQKLSFSTIDVIIVSSRPEVITYTKRFDLKKGVVKYLPFHTNILNPKLRKYSGNYVLSAGRSGRDFALLAESVRDLDIKIVIISDKNSVAGITFSSNVELYCDVDYDVYLTLLENAKLVVVPLKKLVRSTGQVVILEAMSLGIPVIATNTVGTKDYVEDGVNGILVPPEDSQALKDAIQRLIENDALCAILANNALKLVKDEHTIERYTTKILETINELNLTRQSQRI